VAPDLTGTAELVEEVVRLEGYDTIPVVLPTAPAGAGLTAEQRLRRTASRALAAGGLVEVVLPPFVSDSVLEVLGGGMTAPAAGQPRCRPRSRSCARRCCPACSRP
jgi:phenylalanyl-tRNA synthetase beta subunit